MRPLSILLTVPISILSGSTLESGFRKKLNGINLNQSYESRMFQVRCYPTFRLQITCLHINSPAYQLQ